MTAFNEISWTRYYFTIILNAMLSITRIFVIVSKGLASADRIQSVLRLPQNMQVIEAPVKEESAHIVFEKVSFTYPNGTRVLKDIDFSLQPGKTLGIIGATGSGKSTIVKLLLRLYDPTKGMIRIAGRDIRSIDPTELHQLFGVVLQKDVLFAETIEENISEAIDKVYRLENQTILSQFQELLADLPLEYLELSNEIIEYARRELSSPINDSIYISLTDHMHCAIERFP